MAGKKGQKKRFWSDEEKVSICGQTCAPGVSVAQVARRYAMNANLIHKWLRDPQFASDLEIVEGHVAEAPCFLPVEIVDRPGTEVPAPSLEINSTHSAIEIDIAGGHRLKIVGSYDPEALARLSGGFLNDPCSGEHACVVGCRRDRHATRVHDAGGPGGTDAEAGPVHRAHVRLSRAARRSDQDHLVGRARRLPV